MKGGTRGPPESTSISILERVSCCRDEATANELADWYHTIHVPDVLKAEGLIRATRYELYRVVMVEPKRVPRFLTIYELEADSAAQAVDNLRKVSAGMREAGRMSDWFVESDSALYLLIKDVRKR